MSPLAAPLSVTALAAGPLTARALAAGPLATRTLSSGAFATSALAAPAETLTVRAESLGDSLLLHLDWETTRVTIPIKATS